MGEVTTTNHIKRVVDDEAVSADLIQCVQHKGATGTNPPIGKFSPGLMFDEGPIADFQDHGLGPSLSLEVYALDQLGTASSLTMRSTRTVVATFQPFPRAS